MARRASRSIAGRDPEHAVTVGGSNPGAPTIRPRPARRKSHQLSESTRQLKGWVNLTSAPAVTQIESRAWPTDITFASSDMTQDEINEREWNNPGNWGRRLGFYSSSADSRLWVRKPRPWMGSTLNMAKPTARVMVLLFTVLLCVVVAAIVLAVLPR